MGLAGSVLKAFSPYHWGTRIGETFKSKHEDYFLKKYVKKIILNFISPFIAVSIASNTIQFAISMVPFLPLFPEAFTTYGMNSFIPKMVMAASSHVLFGAASAAFFAGMSKEGMKENIKFLMSPSKWSDAEFFSGLQGPASVKQKPVLANKIEVTQDVAANTQTISMAFSEETFTQKDANEIINKAASDGLKEIKLKGSTPQKEKLWLAVQVINWTKERLFQEKLSRKEVWLGDRCASMKVTNFFPSQEDKVYQKWKQIKLNLEKKYSFIEPPPVNQSPPSRYVTEDQLANVSHRKLVLPPRVE